MNNINNSPELSRVQHLGAAFIRPEEGIASFVPVAGRLFVNLCTLPAVPVALAFAGAGALVAHLLGREAAKGARVGSLIGGVLGSLATVLPILGIGLTIAFFSIRGIRKNANEQPAKSESFQELLNKTWRNACAILDTCFPSTETEALELPNTALPTLPPNGKYLPALSIQSSEKALNLEGLPEGKTTQLQNGAMRFDRDAWQCRDSDAVGYSKDHSTVVESEYQGRPCKIIVTMDGEGHCGKDAAVRNKTEETFQGAAASAAETLKSASYDSPMHALTTFRDNFERGTTARISSQDNPVPNYAGKPMMAMILGDKAYFACDSANTADGGFVILNKEGTAARFVSPEDVPCEVDLTKGDRVIAFTDGVLDGLGDAVFKQLSDKAIATLPADLKAQFDRKVKSEARVAVRNSLGKGVQTMLTNLFQLKTAQGQANEDLQKQIDKNLENSPYLNSLKSAIEGYIKDNPQLDINDATRFRLGDEDFSKLFELSIEEIDERISSISTKLESGVSQTDRNTLSLNLNRLKLVKVILEADQDKVMQPKESDLEKIPEAAIQQLISDSLQGMFFSQQDLFRPKGDEERTNNYQNYQNAAYRDFSIGKRQQSNTFMDQSVKSLVENDEWLEEFTQKISAQADNLTLDTSSLYVDMHARRSLQVEAALCRHALSSVLAGAGEGLDDSMKRLNGGAVQALITSNRRANSLDDSTLSGVVV